MINLVYSQAQNFGAGYAQNYQSMQFGQRPPKPPSTKIEGFPIIHFSAYVTLVTTDPPRSEFEQPTTTLYLLAPFLGASNAPNSISQPEDFREVTNPFNLKLKASTPEILKPKNGLQKWCVSKH